jgi:hypothetical protein
MPLPNVDKIDAANTKERSSKGAPRKKRRSDPTPITKQLNAKPIVDATSLIESADFVLDFCRFSESLLSEKFLRRKYAFDQATWERLGSDERVIEAIESARVMRMRNGDSAREKAQQIFVAAPAVIGSILNDSSANAKHRIEASREIRTIANVGPESTPSADRFEIKIILTGDTLGPEIIEHYNMPRKPGLDVTGTQTTKSTAIDADDPGHVDTATLAAIAAKNRSGSDSDGGPRSI